MPFNSIILFFGFVISLNIACVKCVDKRAAKCVDSCLTKSDRRNCFCSECEVYDDCCKDAYRNYSNPNRLAYKFGCILQVQANTMRYRAYAVDKCAEWWDKDNVKGKCELNELNEDLEELEYLKNVPYLHLIPVFSNRSKLAYKNIYCAICNTKDFELKEINILDLHLTYHESNLVLNDLDDQSKKKITEFFQNKLLANDYSISSVFPLRRCIKTIQECPKTSSYAKLCSNYTAIRYFSDTAYKNEYCALCADIYSGFLTCEPKAATLKRQVKTFMSLQVLFDLSLQDKKIAIKIKGDSNMLAKNLSNITLDSIDLDSQIVKNSAEYKEELIKYVMTVVFLTISMTSLTLLLMIYFCFKRLRTLSGKFLISLSSSLLLSQLSFILGGVFVDYSQSNFDFTYSKVFKPCTLFGFATHFLFMTFFVWSSLMAYEMFRKIRSKSVFEDSGDQFKRFLANSLIGWFVPFMVALSLFFKQFIENSLSYGVNVCFISTRIDLIIFFMVPVSVLLFINLIVLIFSIILIVKSDRTSQVTFKKETKPDFAKEKKRIILYLKLAILSGITWVFGIISSLSNNDVLWYIYIVLNSLQGLFIFLSFAFTDKVKSELKKVESTKSSNVVSMETKSTHF